MGVAIGSVPVCVPTLVRLAGHGYARSAHGMTDGVLQSPSPWRCMTVRSCVWA